MTFYRTHLFSDNIESIWIVSIISSSARFNEIYKIDFVTIVNIR